MSITNYLPAEVKIFPILPSELQLKIISFCNPRGLIVLSGVTSDGSKQLTNEVFQKLFKDLHPNIEQTPETLAEIPDLINACGPFCQKQVWGGLYSQCANGAIEDNWAENHFQEFLPNLHAIVSDALDFVRNLYAFGN